MQLRGEGMKCVLMVLGMLMTLSVWAKGYPPSIEHVVKPEYPIDLQRIKLSGEVWVRFMVNADGSVVDPQIIYSTHPQFAGATLKVVRQWRFSTWPLEGDNPAQVEVNAPLVFSFDTSRSSVTDLRDFDLGGATCRQLNTEVERYMRRKINMPLAQLKLFMATHDWLVGAYIAKKYSSEQLAVALFDLSQGMVRVVQTCQQKRSRKFMDILPESVRTLLMMEDARVEEVSTSQAHRPMALQVLADNGG